VIGIASVTGAVLPAADAKEATMRLWLAARATGFVAFLLLTLEVAIGLLMSHPENPARWKLSKRVFPWHENLTVFTLAFVLVHVVSLVADPYAGVGIGGALIPGLSEYRTPAVAVGVLALYAAIISAVTARWTSLLPRGVWLKLHRVSAIAWLGAWAHGVFAGTDTVAATALYVGTGALLVLLAAYRYWVNRPTRRRAAPIATPTAPSTEAGETFAPRSTHMSVEPPAAPEGAA
jgi:sulfoxide reductase heme-binding subunit YedZ